MDERILVVGLGGSIAPVSRSREALRVALRGAEDAGAATELLALNELDLPLYRPDHGSPPPDVVRVCDTVAAAQGLLWASPMYHGTVSGAFKNALDWLQLLADRQPPFLTDKVVGLISTAGGTQGLQAVNTMDFIARALRAWTVPLVIPVPEVWRTFDEQARLVDEGVEVLLRALGGEVASAARRFAAAAPLTDAAAQAGEAELQPLEET